jgi:hypothetical protein
MRRVVRKLALLLAALCPGLALALSGTYEGQLIPRTNDPPISITLHVEELGGFLTGKVSTSDPLKGNANISSGRNVGGFCNLASVVNRFATLRLSGSCDGTSYEGSYNIQYAQSKRVARGTFRLTKKSAESGKPGGALTGADIAANSVVACVKANTRCLAACPRGDTNVEYLCANHCRSKMQACKGKAAKIDSDLE